MLTATNRPVRTSRSARNWFLTSKMDSLGPKTYIYIPHTHILMQFTSFCLQINIWKTTFRPNFEFIVLKFTHITLLKDKKGRQIIFFRQIQTFTKILEHVALWAFVGEKIRSYINLQLPKKNIKFNDILLKKERKKNKILANHIFLVQIYGT